MTYTVLGGTLNPTHSLSHLSEDYSGCNITVNKLLCHLVAVLPYVALNISASNESAHCA